MKDISMISLNRASQSLELISMPIHSSIEFTGHDNNDLLILLEGELFESVSRTLSHVGTVLGGAASFQVIFNKCKFKCISDCQFARVLKQAMMPSPFLQIIQKLPFFKDSSSSDLETAAYFAQKDTFTSGQWVVRQELLESSQVCVYVVLSGEFSVSEKKLLALPQFNFIDPVTKALKKKIKDLRTNDVICIEKNQQLQLKCVSEVGDLLTMIYNRPQENKTARPGYLNPLIEQFQPKKTINIFSDSKSIQDHSNILSQSVSESTNGSASSNSEAKQKTPPTFALSLPIKEQTKKDYYLNSNIIPQSRCQESLQFTEIQQQQSSLEVKPADLSCQSPLSQQSQSPTAKTSRTPEKAFKWLPISHRMEYMRYHSQAAIRRKRQQSQPEYLLQNGSFLLANPEKLIQDYKIKIEAASEQSSPILKENSLQSVSIDLRSHLSRLLCSQLQSKIASLANFEKARNNYRGNQSIRQSNSPPRKISCSPRSYNSPIRQLSPHGDHPNKQQPEFLPKNTPRPLNIHFNKNNRQTQFLSQTLNQTCSDSQQQDCENRFNNLIQEASFINNQMSICNFSDSNSCIPQFFTPIISKQQSEKFSQSKDNARAISPTVSSSQKQISLKDLESTQISNTNNSSSKIINISAAVPLLSRRQQQLKQTMIGFTTERNQPSSFDNSNKTLSICNINDTKEFQKIHLSKNRLAGQRQLINSTILEKQGQLLRNPFNVSFEQHSPLKKNSAFFNLE